MNLSEQTVELLRSLIQGFTTHKTELVIEADDCPDDSTEITIETCNDDYRKIIGRNGQKYNALFFVLRCIYGLNHKKAKLTVNDRGGEFTTELKFKPNPEWKSAKIRPLIARTAELLFERPAEITERSKKGSTHFDIKTAPGERQKADAKELAEALEVIFHAIGKSEGRIVFIHVFKDQMPPEDEQPTSYAGRYSS